MAREEKVVLTNMCMISDGEKILVQDRRNPKWPGITFPGGHVEKGESFVESTIREIKEETNLDICNLEICGIKQFQNEENNRYIVFLYKTSTFKGQIKSSDEGDIFWVERSKLSNYTLAKGFDTMLEIFENHSLTENFHWKDDNGYNVKNL